MAPCEGDTAAGAGQGFEVLDDALAVLRSAGLLRNVRGDAPSLLARGENVVGELLDEPQRPDQQRSHRGRVYRLGGVYAARAAPDVGADSRRNPRRLCRQAVLFG